MVADAMFICVWVVSRFRFPQGLGGGRERKREAVLSSGLDERELSLQGWFPVSVSGRL